MGAWGKRKHFDIGSIMHSSFCHATRRTVVCRNAPFWCGVTPLAGKYHGQPPEELRKNIRAPHDYRIK